MTSAAPPSDVPEARRISRGALRDAERRSGCQVVVVESQSLATISTVSFIAGGALVAGGALMVVLAPSTKVAGLRLFPYVGPSTGGLGALGVF